MNTVIVRVHSAILILAAALSNAAAIADDIGQRQPVRSDSHAPIGVMADHMHKQREWMLSFRVMSMEMKGNRIGKDRVASDFIVTNVPNRFFGMPMQSPTLRIVPVEMTMDMAMLGAMYAPADWITMMVMANYVRKEMDHVTYQGPAGTNVLGTFTTKSDGFGDTYFGAMLRLYDTPNNKLHFNFGITAPTGSTTERDVALTPMGTSMNIRLPYPMQLGSGTWDAKPGLTYNGRAGNFTWGAQYMGTFRTGKENGYNFGSVHELTGWAAWSPRPWISGSARLAFENRDRIDGIDPNIMGPVQTANPDYFGGDTLFGYLGMNLAGQRGGLRGHRLALELGWPIEQDLNGPQMEQDFRLTAGWQYAF